MRWEDRENPGAVKNPKDLYLDVKKVFKGEQHAVLLAWRGKEDNHICIYFAGEDDGMWFRTQGGASSSWLPEFIALINKADTWMKEKCVPDIVNGRQYGYRFK